MADQKPPKQYINKIFISKKWEDKANDSVLYSVGIVVDDFIKELKKHPVNDKGILNLTLVTQKTDKNKMSLFYEEWKGKPKDNIAPGKDDEDSLPF